MIKKILFLLLVIIILSFPIAFAFELKHGFKEFGMGLGFFTADLEDKDDLKETPFVLHFGFDLRPLLKNKSRHLMEFIIEPYSSWLVEPKSNFKTGCNFLLKGGFQVWRIYPYLELGLGVSYFTLQTREQATQFNFTETVGAGINYFIKENLSLNLGYRYQHLSNASIKRPNKGIDAQGFVYGISFYY